VLYKPVHCHWVSGLAFCSVLEIRNQLMHFHWDSRLVFCSEIATDTSWDLKASSGFETDTLSLGLKAFKSFSVAETDTL